MLNATEILAKINTQPHLITKLYCDEIELSLLCNFSDLRTYNYAKNYFPNFYKRVIAEYEILANSFSSFDDKTYFKIANNSLDLIKLAGVIFLLRLDIEKQKPNE